LGRDLPENDVKDIVAFLETLTGEVPANFAQVPMLPVAAYKK
jgi:cytochrome c peroxidase